MQLSISLIFEIISFFAAVIFYFQKRNTTILYFIPFLLLTVTVEVIGRWWPFQRGSLIGKLGMYNIFTSFEFIFYSLLFYIHLQRKASKRLVLFFIPIFSLAVIINLSLIQGLNKTFHSYTFLLGSFFIVVFCCCFFYESVLPARIDQQLSKQPFFWICCGLLIFYLGSVIINALFEYLTSNDLRNEGLRIYNIINRSLNVILYTSFSIAFYTCPNNKKTYLSQS